MGCNVDDDRKIIDQPNNAIASIDTPFTIPTDDTRGAFEYFTYLLMYINDSPAIILQFNRGTARQCNSL